MASSICSNQAEQPHLEQSLERRSHISLAVHAVCSNQQTQSDPASNLFSSGNQQSDLTGPPVGTPMAPPRKRKEPEAGSLAHLTVDRLRRRLKAAKLSLSGNKKTLTDRLRAHLADVETQATPRRSTRRRAPDCQSDRARHRSHSRSPRETSADRQHDRDSSHSRQRDSQGSHTSRQTSRQSRQRDSRSSRRHSRPRLHSHRVSHSRSRSPSRSSTSSSDDEWCERAAKHHKHRSQRRTKHRHRKRRRSRSSSSSTTSSSSSSTSDSSSDDTSDNRNRRRRKKRKHNHSRLRLPSNTKGKLKKLAVSCCPPLQERYCARIARGEYVSFDKLLIPKGHRYPPDSDKHKHKQPGNRVTGLATWLEAWNRFAGVVLVTHPKRALEMLKYQTLVSSAFQDYPPEACLEYDRCFRQLAAKDKNIKWDKYKEDIFIWCFSPKPASAGSGNQNAWEPRSSFRHNRTIMSRLGPPQDSSTHTPSGAEICIRFNTTRGCSKGETCKYTHVCSRKGCHGDHPAGKCPTKPKPT